MGCKILLEKCTKHDRNVMSLMVIMDIVLVLMETIMVCTGM